MFRKGYTPWNKGVPTPKNVRSKISRSLTGIQRSEESKKNYAVSKLGSKNPNFGKTMSLEQRKKIGDALRGEKNYRWSGGGNHTERVRFRDQLQKKVFERDNYTCQICSQKGGYLQVDHIQSWAEYVELRFNIENCRTLCMGCHYEITFKKPIPKHVKSWGHKLKEVFPL